MAIQRFGIGPRYSKAVVHGDTVYLAGQVAANPVPSVAEQTKQILAQIDRYLAECGTDKSKLLSAFVMFKDLRDFDAVNEIWDAWVVPGSTPCRTPIETRLYAPEFLVAIQVTAAR
ncbi:MAG: RidA family protein [Reyranellaceae bacterium]